MPSYINLYIPTWLYSKGNIEGKRNAVSDGWSVVRAADLVVPRPRAQARAPPARGAARSPDCGGETSWCSCSGRKGPCTGVCVARPEPVPEARLPPRIPPSFWPRPLPGISLSLSLSLCLSLSPSLPFYPQRELCVNFEFRKQRCVWHFDVYHSN